MKSAWSQQWPKHQHAMQNQSRLTSFGITISSVSPTQHTPAPLLLWPESLLPTASLPQRSLPPPSSPLPSSPLLTQSPLPISLLPAMPQLQPLSPESTSALPSTPTTPAAVLVIPAHHPGDQAIWNQSVQGKKCRCHSSTGTSSLVCRDLDEPDGFEGEGSNAEDDKAAIKGVLGASGVDSGLKVEVRSWTELQEQLKGDIVDAHKKWATLTMINQLLILCNFATLQIKELGRIKASQQIAQQWHDGKGAHFAHHVHVLACHYQVLKQLPAQMAGGYQGCLIISDECVQNAAWNWLTKLSTEEVSPKWFCRALTKEILPCLGINRSVSEWTARWWLVKLGWCQTCLKKGIYMDGHEQNDIVKYRNKIFLPLITQYEVHMVKWIECEDRTFEHVKPELGSGEKWIITLFCSSNASMLQTRQN